MHLKANPLPEYGKKAQFWSINIFSEEHEELSFRSKVQEPIKFAKDLGALVTVMHKGAIAYASTQDLSENGIKKAFDQALMWCERLGKFSLLHKLKPDFESAQGEYHSPGKLNPKDVKLKDKLDLLREADLALQTNAMIVDTNASIWSIQAVKYYENSVGSKIQQNINQVIPGLSATAHHQGISQIRTLGGMRALCQQGDWQSILDTRLIDRAKIIAEEAIELVHAPNCPTKNMDLLIDPDQMMLQIHESIGHPLELDRILGDERNYAGTSFVKLDMFGKYQYGSKLLNVTFDPHVKNEFASYNFDDEGTVAKREYLIKDGLLIKPLGAKIAQQRAGMDGVANARSCSWNRPPIDRMANLNVEPGQSSFKDMLQSIEKGIYVKSNTSWSIDDSRNKFQFGCEWGQLIEDGKLTKVVRNPNYRGISANFWRSLKMVGDTTTVGVLGSPYCGKGEPNQCIRVGHASPVCLFSNIDVFGGE